MCICGLPAQVPTSVRFWADAHGPEIEEKNGEGEGQREREWGGGISRDSEISFCSNHYEEW